MWSPHATAHDRPASVPTDDRVRRNGDRKRTPPRNFRALDAEPARARTRPAGIRPLRRSGAQKTRPEPHPARNFRALDVELTPTGTHTRRHTPAPAPVSLSR